MGDPSSAKNADPTLKRLSKRVATETKGDAFGRLSSSASSWLGSKWAFGGAILVIVAWAATGPLFHFSDTWQLVINTGTTIVTFLMVFLIQNTQNRDARAIDLKLDEVIRSIDAAGDEMMNIESLSDAELDVVQKRYERIRAARLARQTHPKKSK
ncbi:MAG TPA: low affinity iron permease family protein [Acidobacteriaceae bacterium]|jgi:low affinity Fe/Cu permease